MAMAARYPMAASLSRFEVGGLSLRLRQFAFEDSPPNGAREGTDCTGLKVWPTATPMLRHLQRLVHEKFSHLERIRILEYAKLPLLR
jgi:hypothetical protein